MSYNDTETVVCKVYDFIGKTLACKLNTVVNNLKALNVSENSIKVAVSRLKRANLVMQHKYNNERNLFITTLKKPLHEVKEIVNKLIQLQKEKTHGH